MKENNPKVMNNIVITNDIYEQVRIGRELFESKQDIYNPKMIALVKDTIDRIVQGPIYHTNKGDIKTEELFFISRMKPSFSSYLGMT